MKIFRILTVIITLSLMGFIFYMSAQNSTESSGTSQKVIVFVLKIFMRDFESISEIERAELISSLQFIVRKSAHFSVYALLGAFSYLSVATYKSIPFYLRSGIGAMICLVYAISDEIHQYFVPGRSCEIRDVCIDFCGALLAVTLLSVVAKYSKAKIIINNI